MSKFQELMDAGNVTIRKTGFQEIVPVDELIAPGPIELVYKRWDGQTGKEIAPMIERVTLASLDHTLEHLEKQAEELAAQIAIVKAKRAAVEAFLAKS